MKQNSYWYSTCICFMMSLTTTYAQNVDHKAVDHKAVDHKAIDHKAIDHKAVDHKANSSTSNTTIHQWVEQYYLAKDFAEMQHVLQKVQAEYPKHYLRWELESYHSQFHLQSLHSMNQAVKVLAQNSSLDSYPALLHTMQAWPHDQRTHYAQKSLHIAQNHPHPAIRAGSAWTLRHRAHYMNEKTLYQQATEALGPILPFSIIGTWDNDQGKGLDTVFPPEEKIEFDVDYQGKLLPIRWRSDYPKDLRSKINFKQLLAPTQWQIAYATSAIQLNETTQVELRVTSSDPFKVWIDGTLVMHIKQLDGWLFDGFVIPLHLTSGQHQILIKSAQKTGQWLLSARLTGVDGKALTYKVLPAKTVVDLPVKSTVKVSERVLGVNDVIDHYRSYFDPRMSIRQNLHTLTLLSEAGLSIECLKLAENLAVKYPKSVLIKFNLMLALWQEGERGRTADILNQLLENSPLLPLFAHYQSRFWQQQHLSVKARTLAKDLLKKHPKNAQVYQILANLYQKKGWNQESFQLIKKSNQLDPHDVSILRDLIALSGTVGFIKQKELLESQLIEMTPYLERHLKHAYQQASKSNDTTGMIYYANLCTQQWTQSQACYTLLAQSYWQDGQIKKAFDTLDRMVKLNPLNPVSYQLRGQWYLLQGHQDKALVAWDEALKRTPNNQSLALRIDEMKPQTTELWLKDVPSETDIKAIIASRDQIKPKEGANSIYLIDDDVTLLKLDGGSISVTTTVVHALNQEGRDDLTKMYVGRSSNTQLMAAYAINPDGTRIEASSIRDGVVRFRKIKVGSTVVLQHRKTHKPEAYLAGHITRNWWFHSSKMQVKHSRLVLWRPKDIPLNEIMRGAVQKEVQAHGDLIRVRWEMRDLDPVITEPRMPSLFSQVFGLTLSTVPGWEEVFKWEKELLREAFRMSPQVEELSNSLLKDLPSAQSKIYRIQEYVMRNIRYQQDYEHTIAGVKPHTADQVLSRQYGDCKDKAVLFIALAKKAGLKAHFAIVRTRNAGPVDKEIPSQQFNHAIVYVPAQEGIKEGRFYDPTVDELDVASLRTDDQGTLALVYDPIKEKHYWKEIPFQNTSFNQTRDIIRLKIDADGKMTGSLLMKSRGRIAQIIRKQARNPESFKQVMQYRVNQLFAGAQLLDHTAIEVKDLYSPAQASMTFKHDSWVKREGKHFRIPAVIDWTPKQLFQLKERRYPLVLGPNKEWSWQTEIELPQDLEASHMPNDEVIASDCLSLSRTSEWIANQNKIKTIWTYRSICERLNPNDYLKHRELSRQMISSLNQEIVLSTKTILKQE